MKKKLLAAFTVLILCLAVLTGCSDKTDQILAVCTLDNTQMELPIEFESAVTFGDGTSFTTRLTLQEITDTVNEIHSDTAEYTAECYENAVLIWMKTKENSKMHVFSVLRNWRSSDENRLKFFNSSTSMGEGNIPIPFHLIDYRNGILEYEGEDYPYETDEYTTIEEYLKYPLLGTYEAFADFYRKTGAFDVTESPNQILLTVKEGAYVRKEVKTKNMSYTFDNKPKSKWFTVDFIEKDGIISVRYQAEPLDNA